MAAHIPTRGQSALGSRKDGALSGVKGSSQIFILGVFVMLFIASGVYLYSVNRNAVQGYHLRALEKEIAILSEANAQLRISEADMRSFYRINERKDELQMQKTEALKYLENKETLAFKQ